MIRRVGRSIVSPVQPCFRATGGRFKPFANTEAPPPPRDFSEAYLRWCGEHGATPRGQRSGTYEARGYAFSVFRLREEATERVLVTLNGFCSAAAVSPSRLANLSPATSLVEDLDFDTVDAREFALLLEEEFCVEIPPSRALSFSSVDSVVDYLLYAPLAPLPNSRLARFRRGTARFFRSARDRVIIVALLFFLVWGISTIVDYVRELTTFDSTEYGMLATRKWISSSNQVYDPTPESAMRGAFVRPPPKKEAGSTDSKELKEGMTITMSPKGSED